MTCEITMFSSDKAPGGIRQMLIFYAQALRHEGYDVRLVIPTSSKNIEQFDTLKISPSANDKKFTLHFFSKLQLSLLRIGLKTGQFRKLKRDGFFIVHTAKLIPALKRAFPKSFLVSVDHTDKPKSLAYHKKADGVIVLSSHQYQTMLFFGFSEKQIYKVPNCTDSASWVYRPKKDGPLTFGSLGRFVANKGFADFIKAIGSINAKAILAGEGPLDESLRQDAKTFNADVEFTGWIKDKDHFFSKIDVLCLSSTFEPFGIVVLEAMARGIPVIATKTAGPMDIIEDGVSGLLVETGSPEQMAKAMLKLDSDRDLLAKISENSHKSFVEKYTVSCLSNNLANVISDYEKMYQI